MRSRKYEWALFLVSLVASCEHNALSRFRRYFLRRPFLLHHSYFMYIPSDGIPEVSSARGESRQGTSGESAMAAESTTSIGGIDGAARAGSGMAGGSGGKGRSTVATKRLRLLLLHGNSAAASLLLQVNLVCLVEGSQGRVTREGQKD